MIGHQQTDGQESVGRMGVAASDGYELRQARSNGRRHAWGAISWCIALGPQEPGR